MSEEAEVQWQPARLKPEAMWCEAARYEHTPVKDERVRKAQSMVLHVRPIDGKLPTRDCGCPIYLVHPEDVKRLSGIDEAETAVSLCQIWTD